MIVNGCSRCGDPEYDREDGLCSWCWALDSESDIEDGNFYGE